MGKVQLFEIRLGESRVVYSPGEPLAGTVTVRLSGSLQYRGERAACPPPPGTAVPPARLPRAAGPGGVGPGTRCPRGPRAVRVPRGSRGAVGVRGAGAGAEGGRGEETGSPPLPPALGTGALGACTSLLLVLPGQE